MTMSTARVVALVLLAAAVGSIGCYDPDSLTAPDDVFLMTATPSAIPADGFSVSRITVRVDPQTNRDVTFSFAKSDGGSLSIPATQTRGPDANGEISVLLTSDTTPRTVVVTADAKDGTTVLASRSVTVTFESPSAASIIRLIASSTSLEADGTSSIQLRAEVNPGLPNRTVTFKTSNGSFEKGGNAPVRELPNVPTGADGVAVVQLYAPAEVGTAIVSASSGNFSDFETVTFTPAAPDFMTLRASPLTVSRASELNGITVTATLSRSVGVVSGNTAVDFLAVNDDTGTSFGRFEEITRSANGQVTARFVPGTAAPLGLATITARVPNTSVSAQVKITVTP